jgi:hypothetical protein
MATPVVPLEKKRLLGNPGGRPLPKQGEIMSLEGGYIEPPRPLEWAGKQLWDSVYAHGELWVSKRTDSHFLLMTCEQLDRRESLRAKMADSDDWHLLKQLNDLERLIAVNLGQLGFTPAERTRLGLAEVKRQSKLEEMMSRRKAVQ